MRVLLAGYNVDAEVLEALKSREETRDDVTPETLSAAYARISRDPRPVDELRRAARAEVERARKSNRTIIFKMGHHSVAEHAVFNFDVIGISRLAVEALERFRLCSFTEKSQRYIALGDDFVVPAEVRNAGLEKPFSEMIGAQNALYHALFKRLRPYFLERHPGEAADPAHLPILEGWAKEDARYALGLAAEGQLGMTLNGRNLELVIRRFAAHELEEVRELGRRFCDLAAKVAPSIVLFTEACAFDSETRIDLAAEAENRDLLQPEPGDISPLRRAGDGVRLVEYPAEGDEIILASLIHSLSSVPFSEIRTRVRALGQEEKLGLFRRTFERMEFFDFPLREFEFADLTFELIVSASCFAQLKRHRMATLTVQRYHPSLGVTVPQSIRDIGAEDAFRNLTARTEETWDLLRRGLVPDAAADYVLTNAHRRRVLFKVNVRELYHVSRLREDATAQWDIRAVVERMKHLAEGVLPLSCLLLGGKDAYPKIYERVFGKRPAVEPPRLFK
jgi:flavin-dependent thymidylate synthase